MSSVMKGERYILRESAKLVALAKIVMQRECGVLSTYYYFMMGKIHIIV